jgi:Hypothetical protein (DUF2513)
MRLNQDCVRDFLLELEEKLEFNDTIFLGQFEQLKVVNLYGKENCLYTLGRLIEAQYLNAKIQYASDEVYGVFISSLTWDGHQFLDTIRDNEIWTRTKEATKKLSSTSLPILSALATEFLKQKLGLK